MQLTYDIGKNGLVTGTGAFLLNAPALAFHQQYNVELHVKNGDANMNLSSVSTWRAAIDKDDLSSTIVMCRTLNDGINTTQAFNGILNIVIDTDTETFFNAVRRKISGIICSFELWGFDDGGHQAFYLAFPVRAYPTADPYGGIVPPAPVNGTIDVTQLQTLVKKYIPVRLAACSSLGMTSSPSGFSWVDPNDVTLDGATLATWEKTALVRKAGENYPVSIEDGTILATTERAAGNKNYYRDHTFIDTTAVSGINYKYKLFSMSEITAVRGKFSR